MLKIKGSEIQQALAELMMQALGPDALSLEQGTSRAGGSEQLGPPYPQPLAETYCNMRKTSIYAGSNEIQKNIIAHTILSR
jgi:alkylation response protein AidB-like acyl-CoA dehydrogenase